MENGAHYDVIVLGSGAGGLTAAITASAHGRSVLLVEKADVIGGTLAWSGGGVWVPGNHHMADVGESDSPEKARLYLRGHLGNYYDEEAVDAFLSNAAEAFHFLEGVGKWIRFKSYPGSDYHPLLPGAAEMARSMLPVPFDGRVLGAWLAKLRRPKREMTIFGGLQIEAAEIPLFQDVFRSPSAFAHVVRRLAQYGLDLIRHGRSVRLIRGTALAAALLRTALDLRVTIMHGTQVSRLLQDETGRVTGIRMLARPGEDGEIVARCGVVLATGGFSANKMLRQRYLPDPANHLTLLPSANGGDGISLALAAGAVMGAGAAAPAIYAPASRRHLSDGSESVYPHFMFDRCKPGSMIVGPDGQRFVNEAESYHTLVQRMHALKISPAWLIAGHVFLRRYGMGLARPAPNPYRHLIREGYLIRGRSLHELATKIGVDPAGLRESAERMTRYAQAGNDPDFGRGGDIYTRNLGDPAHGPNSSLGAVDVGPFYAVALYPTDVGTSLGLAVRGDGAVLAADGTTIPGLFAAGLDANAALRGFYPGAGTQIGQAMAMGYASGKSLADE
ncbi:FAD-dependent oxidoreductase [Sphingobium sp. CR2-8]|uniref:FAD-dependent oxidoreductase n=1 Tax=Sphingobium sp. CR2-8 TaxID=1306534 RepID=UPI002DBDCDF6|nr:FAD-dependent oxidoreductase [Sphingobium sp. CR2-8]MEC3911889.1 FAD-dependent oxidoreductase [Sphingobium sp. CR2-8]